MYKPFTNGSSHIDNWIFVTGVIRSGTTFVGMNLSLPREVDYIHEPFNPQCGLREINRWYAYIRPNVDTPSMQEYHTAIQSIFSYKFKLRNKIPKEDPVYRQLLKRLIGSRGPFYLRQAKLNPFHNTAVIKDPIGCLLAEYLYIHFQVKPVVIVKHPISFIASLKRVKWLPHVEEMSDQPELMNDFFQNDPNFAEVGTADPISAGAMYWRAVYKVLLSQASRYSDWHVITHEDLSSQPIPVFQKLYDSLGLQWTPRIERKILAQTQGNQSAQARKGRVQDFNRNSADIFRTRVQELTLAERRLVFDIVQDVALEIYSKDSFALHDD